MNKILVVGNFGLKTCTLNGQSIRTKTIYDSLKKNITDHDIVYTDISNKNILNLIIGLFHILTSSRIIILPGMNGLGSILKTLYYLKHLEKTTFVVIGGWLSDYLKKNDNISVYLNKLNAILVQTCSLRSNLLSQGIKKVYHFPNYRINQIDTEAARTKKTNFQNAVFYSRVCREKGTDLAIKAIIELNNKSDDKVNLDIYGPIQDDFNEELQSLLKNDNINYKGTLANEESIPTLSKYDCMLFPTHYEGEGFPGVILESFIAGVPVVASDWKYNSEIICDGKTGYIFDTYSLESLVEKLMQLKTNPKIISEMSEECLLESKKYHESKVFPILLECLK